MVDFTLRSEHATYPFKVCKRVRLKVIRPTQPSRYLVITVSGGRVVVKNVSSSVEGPYSAPCV